MVKAVNTFQLGEIGNDRFRFGAELFNIAGGVADSVFIRGDHKVETVLGATFGEFITNARGRARDNRKRSAVSTILPPVSSYRSEPNG